MRPGSQVEFVSGSLANLNRPPPPVDLALNKGRFARPGPCVPYHRHVPGRPSVQSEKYAVSSAGSICRPLGHLSGRTLAVDRTTPRGEEGSARGRPAKCGHAPDVITALSGPTGLALKAANQEDPLSQMLTDRSPREECPKLGSSGGNITVPSPDDLAYNSHRRGRASQELVPKTVQHFYLPVDHNRNWKDSN